MYKLDALMRADVQAVIAVGPPSWRTWIVVHTAQDVVADAEGYERGVFASLCSTRPDILMYDRMYGDLRCCCRTLGMMLKSTLERFFSSRQRHGDALSVGHWFRHVRL